MADSSNDDTETGAWVLFFLIALLLFVAILGLFSAINEDNLRVEAYKACLKDGGNNCTQIMKKGES